MLATLVSWEVVIPLGISDLLPGFWPLAIGGLAITCAVCVAAFRYEERRAQTGQSSPIVIKIGAVSFTIAAIGIYLILLAPLIRF